jgi:signal transduction histidine kinase
VSICISARASADSITNAADVLVLTAAEAAEARPVQLRGVVIDESEPRDRALVLADSSGGVYLLANTSMLAPYHRGDLLEVSGVTDPGQFAPIVRVSAAHKLGIAPLPPARLVTLHQLVSGTEDAQWVEIRGVVQQYLAPAPGAPNAQIQRIVLSVDGGSVHVRIRGPRAPDLQEDAEVRVQALCFYQHNQKRQMLRPVLQVPAGMSVTVEKPAPADPFAAPVCSAASLLLYSPGKSFGHRVHMRGVVTHGAEGSFVWIRDNSSGFRIQTRSPEPVQAGDLVDVLGFPKYGSATPNLEDAVFRKLGATNLPTPFLLANPTNAFDYGDELVSLEADLNEVTPVAEGLALSLRSGDFPFKAMLRSAESSHPVPAWQAGSRVRIAGICSVTYDDARPLMGIWHPVSFQLLLRSPADLAILQPPPWWTLKHVTNLLGVALGVTLLIAGLAMLQARQRLREQRQQRAMAEAEFAAILSERNRVAREIHDTLAQGLVATSLQLRLARKNLREGHESLSQHLDSAQDLVRDSLQEARNSIWNMRSQVLETGDLPAALHNLLKQMAEGSDIKTEFKVTGNPRRLAPFVENNLLRLGQEGITNAVRHAQASQIGVELDFGEKQFRLSVRDDGQGFNTTEPPKSNGGFGLVGMRERAKEMQGSLDVRSSPGKGTELVLSVPVTG